jgi:hypothetical protein
MRKKSDHLSLLSRASEFQAAICTRFRCQKRLSAPLSGLWLSWLRARCVATHAHLWRELRFGCCDPGGQFRLDKYPAVVIIDVVGTERELSRGSRPAVQPCISNITNLHRKEVSMGPVAVLRNRSLSVASALKYPRVRFKALLTSVLMTLALVGARWQSIRAANVTKPAWRFRRWGADRRHHLYTI